MKKLFFLLLTLVCSDAFAQSPLEKAVLDELNSYRAKMVGKTWAPPGESELQIGKLQRVSYDPDISKLAKHHAEYLKRCTQKYGVRKGQKLRHDEREYDLPDFEEMTFQKRSDLFDKEFPSKPPISEILIPVANLHKGLSRKELAQLFISAFDESPPHKASMLTDFSESLTGLVGVSVLEVPDADPKVTNYHVVIVFGYSEK